MPPSEDYRSSAYTLEHAREEIAELKRAQAKSDTMSSIAAAQHRMAVRRWRLKLVAAVAGMALSVVLVGVVHDALSGGTALGCMVALGLTAFCFAMTALSLAFAGPKEKKP